MRTKKKIDQVSWALYRASLDSAPSHPTLLADHGPAQFFEGPIDVHALHTDTAETLGCDSAFENDEFKDGAVLIEDGSGTAVRDPSSPQLHLEYYCYWKGTTMARWFIIVDPYGRIVFCSAVYPGKQSDQAGRELSKADE